MHLRNEEQTDKTNITELHEADFKLTVLLMLNEMRNSMNKNFNKDRTFENKSKQITELNRAAKLKNNKGDQQQDLISESEGKAEQR